MIQTYTKADWLGFVLFTKLQGIGHSQAAQSMNATFKQSGNLANILRWENSHPTKSFQQTISDHVIKIDEMQLDVTIDKIRYDLASWQITGPSNGESSIPTSWQKPAAQ